MPPTLLEGKTAADLHNQLTNHAVFKMVSSGIKHIRKYCDVFVDLLQSDSAASNEKLVHGYFNASELIIASLVRCGYESLSTLDLIDWARCHSHQNFLLSIGTLCLFPGLLSAGYRLAKFLETRHHAAKYGSAISYWFDQPGVVSVRKCDVASTFSPAVKEFIDYISRWASISHRQRDLADADDDDSYKTSHTAKRLNSYFELCPRSLTQLPEHECVRMPGSALTFCCNDHQETTDKLKRAAADAFVRHVQSPGTNKWTQQWPCFDFLYAGYKLHRHQRDVWTAAFNGMVFERDCGSRNASENAQQGTRCGQTGVFLKDDAQQFGLECLTISCESVRCITLYFFRACKTHCTIRSLQTSSVQTDLLNPPYSILTAAHQYIAGILFDAQGSGRLLLVWDGLPSFASWESANVATGRLRTLRRALLQTDASTWKRHDLEICGLPWSLCSNVDTRLNHELLAVRRRTQSHYDSLSACCCPPGIAWTFKTLGITSLELATTPRSLHTLMVWHYDALWPGLMALDLVYLKAMAIAF